MAERFDVNDIANLPSFDQLKQISTLLTESSKALSEAINKVSASTKKLSTSLQANEKDLKATHEALQAVSDKGLIKMGAKTDELIASNKELNAQFKAQQAELDKLKEKLKGVNKQKEEATTLERERIRLQKIITQGTKEEKQEVANLREAVRKQNAELKQNAQEAGRVERAYERLVKQTREAKNKARELGAQYNSTGKAFKKARNEAQRLDRQLKKLDASVGDNFRNVGNYTKALSGATKVMGALGIAGGIQLAIQGFNKMIDVTQEFEQQMARVRAVTGATGSEFEALQRSALALGATTSKTAKEVGSLQEEFGKLGFNTNEILAATEATLNLAIATQTDLSTAAEVAGGTLRAFGLEASEMARVTDNMAAAFAGSALDISKYRNSMKFVAPDARAAGISIERVNADLAVLANNSISGSQAGTALRRIYSEMAKTGKDASEALSELGEKGLTVNDAFDEVGRSAQTALLVLTKNTEQSDLLTKAFENSAGAAKRMADIVEDTLTGDIAKLNSAWEGLLLSLSQGGGVFRTVVQGLTSFLSVLQGMPSTQREVTSASLDLVESLHKQGTEAQTLLDRYKELTRDGVIPTADEKEELNNVIVQLGLTLGEEVLKLNASTGALELNQKATENLIAQKFILANAEAAIDIQRLKSIKAEEAQSKISLRLAEENQKRTAAVIGETDNLKFRKQRIQGLFFGVFKSKEEAEFVDAFNRVTELTEAQNDRLSERAEIMERLKATFSPEQLEGLFNPEETEEPETTVTPAGGQAGGTRAERQVQSIATVNDLLERQREIIIDIRAEEAKEFGERRPEFIKDLNRQYERNEELLKSLVFVQTERAELEAVQLATLENLTDEELKRWELLRKQKDEAQLLLDIQLEMAKLRSVLNSPITRGIIAGLKTHIKDVALLAGAEATLAAIQQGKTVNESLSAGLQTVIGIKAYQAISGETGTFKEGGFVEGHQGGYTGNGGINTGIPTILHGQEHVLTASQTAKYGLQGLTAKGFDQAIESGQLNQFANVNGGIAQTLATQQVIYQNNTDIDYEKLGKAVGDNMPVTDLKFFGDHLVHSEKRGSKIIETVFKSSKSAFTPRYN